MFSHQHWGTREWRVNCSFKESYMEYHSLHVLVILCLPPLRLLINTPALTAFRVKQGHHQLRTLAAGLTASCTGRAAFVLSLPCTENSYHMNGEDEEGPYAAIMVLSGQIGWQKAQPDLGAQMQSTKPKHQLHTGVSPRLHRRAQGPQSWAAGVCGRSNRQPSVSHSKHHPTYFKCFSSISLIRIMLLTDECTVV